MLLMETTENIRTVKSMRMRRARQVVGTGEMKMHTKFRLESMKGRDNSENLGVDRRSILNGFLGNRVRGDELDSSGSRQGPVVCSCKHGHEPSCSIKGGEFLISCFYNEKLHVLYSSPM
jgi:hypothetical protein